MSNEFSIFARFNFIDPVRHCASTIKLNMSRGTLSPPQRLLGQSKIRTEERRYEKEIKREIFTVSRNWASRIWEEKCRARWPSPLPIIPAPTRYFSIPISSPVFPFSPRFNTGGTTARERGVKWFDWAFSICRISFFPWRSDALFVLSRTEKKFYTAPWNLAAWQWF